MSRLDPAAATAALATALEQVRDAHDLHGASAAAVTSGSAAVLVAAVGHRDPGRTALRSPGDAFRTASCTKAVTATLAVQQARAGALDLDRPVVAQCGGDLAARIEALSPHARAITPRDLLGMRSGLADLLADEAFLGRLVAGEGPWSLDELLDAAAHHLGGSAVAPGGFRYADTGYWVIGRLLEEITGLDLAALLRRDVLDPLGLTRSWLEHHEPPPAGVALSGHLADGLDLSAADTSWDVAGGGMAATAADLAGVLVGILGGPLLAPADVAVLTAMRADVEFADPARVGYDAYGLGLGEMALPSGRRVVGVTGAWGAFAVCDPAAAVVLAGTVDTSPLDRRPIIDALLDAVLDGRR